MEDLAGETAADLIMTKTTLLKKLARKSDTGV